MRHSRLLAGAIAGSALIGSGLFFWHRSQIRAEWRRSLPAPSAGLSGKNPGFIARLVSTRAAAEKDPGNVAAATELTLLCLANGFDSEAEKGLRLLIALQPGEPRWPHLLAKLLSGYGGGDEASTWHAKAVALAPDYIPARIAWAETLLRHNEIDAAAVQYRAVLARAPAEVPALIGLARIDLAAGHAQEAKSKLVQAVTADPSSAATHHLLVTALEKLGNPAAAETERAAAADLGNFRKPDDPWSDELIDYCYDPYRLRIAASAYGFAKRTDRALPLLTRALALDSKDAHTPALLGRLYLAEKKFAEARSQLRQAIALDPRVTEPYLDLAQIAKEERDLSTGLRVLSEGLVACPESAELHHEYAMALSAKGEIAEAFRHFRSAQHLNPNHVASFQDFALLCSRLGRDAEGLEAPETVSAKVPYDREVLTLLTRYQIHAGNSGAAEDFFRRTQQSGVAATTLTELREAFQRQFGHPLREAATPGESAGK